MCKQFRNFEPPGFLRSFGEMVSSLDLQQTLFEKALTRSDLIGYVSTIPPGYRVSIYRNHSFELIEHTIRPFLDFAGVGVEFKYSDYDDSLGFLDLDIHCDVVILWLDISRYAIADIEAFVRERISALKYVFKKNILVVTLGLEMSIQDERVTIYSLSKIHRSLAEKFLDLRLEAFSGTKLSSAACIAVAKDIGLNYLPALLKPALKGVVVDLDNTLYRGVLGEDGAYGVVLSEGHRQLQERLRELAAAGFFLCVASKNDEQDVFDLFCKRNDFPLRIEDFTKICANWSPKAASIDEIAAYLNINSDSLLFIDDNLGEIASVSVQHPNLRVLWAKDDAALTLDVLNNYPGLLKLNTKIEDHLRIGDVKANEQRQQMLNALSTDDYFKSLNMELIFDINNTDHVSRASELANKTNQFIFSYRRYSPQDIVEMMSGTNSVIITISLKDTLNDSGIIGVVALKREQDYALLDECLISCRVLGRGIDETMVLGAIKVGLEFLALQSLKVDFRKGERNLPAEDFADQYLSSFKTSANAFCWMMQSDLVRVAIKGA
jgi:FkbH-like protein